MVFTPMGGLCGPLFFRFLVGQIGAELSYPLDDALVDRFRFRDALRVFRQIENCAET